MSTERGVPAEYLVAILGVETVYGRSTGRYRVLDALATLSFDYPPRAAYFRQELEQFLLLARDREVDPLNDHRLVRGRNGCTAVHAVELSPVRGRRDGQRQARPVVQLVGRVREHRQLLRRARLATGEPVLVDSVGINPADDPAAFRFDRADTVGAIRERGYRFDTTQPADAPAWLVPAERADGPAWRVGFNNFYVITRYNRSSRYAMAVNDLAVALRARVGQLAARES